MYLKMSETTFDKQRELPKLAERLMFANAIIIDYRKELSKLQQKHGEDVSYIAELEYENKRLKEELDQMKKNPLAGMKLKKFAEEELVKTYKIQIQALDKKAKASKVARDTAICELTRLKGIMEERGFDVNGKA